MRHLDERDVAPNPGLRTIAPLGSSWAEPDHDDAVRALRQSFDDSVRQRLAARGALEVTASYSAAASLAVMRARLSQLPGELASYRTNWPRL